MMILYAAFKSVPARLYFFDPVTGQAGPRHAGPEEAAPFLNTKTANTGRPAAGRRR